MNLRCTIEEKIHVKLAPKTAAGNDAPVDGKPTWSVVAGSGTINEDEDGLGAFLISSDAPGDTEFRVDADADLGEGTRTISDSIILTSVAAEASNLGLVADAPVSKF